MIRIAILGWMSNRQWFLYYPRLFTFWEWVVTPKSWGGHLGLINWIKYVRR